LPFEIANAIGRDEEGPDGSVGIVGAEIAMLHIEPGDAAGLTAGFEDRSADVTIPQLLRQMKILAYSNVPEFVSVFCEVIVEEMLIAKSGPPGQRERRRRQGENRAREYAIAHPAQNGSRRALCAIPFCATPSR
jgi:hypothetical protein